MIRVQPAFALLLLVQAPLAVAQSPSATVEIKTVKQLVAAIEAREKAVKSVSLELRTSGVFPGGATFTTEGTLRVLDATHFHSSMKSQFGDDMVSESETVKTPDGVMMRERDPAQGEVFVRIDKDLIAEIESASRVLGESSPALAPGAEQLAGPLGSTMIADLDGQFTLSVQPPKVVDDTEVWVVGGARRDDAGRDSDAFGTADRVEVLVRRADFAVIRMTMFAAGKPMVDVRMKSIEIDVPMDKASFKLTVPRRAKVIDVMDHVPARAQIDRIFAEAEAKGWKRTDDGEQPRDRDAEDK